MVRAVTGWDMTVEELERAGERIVNLERLFNVREGVRRAQDTLPWRVMHEPIPEGPSAGAFCPADGRIAQLGERGPYKAEVTGSIPVPPTTEILHRSLFPAQLAL